MTCPCKSEKAYENCCKRFHEGVPPESALLLMRSRYSAYALNLSDYIIRTTDPKGSQYYQDLNKWKKNIIHFSQTTRFENLTILDFQETDLEATVTFTVYLISEGDHITFTEKSLFKKEGSSWLYFSGEQI